MTPPSCLKQQRWSVGIFCFLLQCYRVNKAKHYTIVLKIGFDLFSMTSKHKIQWKTVKEGSFERMVKHSQSYFILICGEIQGGYLKEK